MSKYSLEVNKDRGNHGRPAGRYLPLPKSRRLLSVTYNAGMEIVLIGIGVGLASVAGVRAFLPLALVALFSALGLFEPPSPYVDVGGDGWWWSAFGVLAALSILETALDKIGGVERAFNVVMVPVRALAGGVLFTAGSGFDVDAGSAPWLVVGALIAGVVAVLKVLLRPPATGVSSGVSTSFLSLIEDLAGLIGGAVALFVPYLPVLLVAFLLFFFSRIRKRRGRKFGGLRILGD
ncbi:MAG: DUF4126 domain-containing protein [Actinomycetota bacterium]|nr:DUF4126 domain-containing protein [Actinomycetota bacterium]